MFPSTLALSANGIQRSVAWLSGGDKVTKSYKTIREQKNV